MHVEYKLLCVKLLSVILSCFLQIFENLHGNRFPAVTTVLIKTVSNLGCLKKFLSDICDKKGIFLF